jgi:hypothetical protein
VLGGLRQPIDFRGLADAPVGLGLQRTAQQRGLFHQKSRVGDPDEARHTVSGCGAR